MVKWSNTGTFGRSESRMAEPPRDASTTYRPCVKCNDSFMLSANEVQEGVITCPSCRDREELEREARPVGQVAVMKLPKAKLSALDKMVMKTEEMNHWHWQAKKAETPKARKAAEAKLAKLKKANPGWAPPEVEGEMPQLKVERHSAGQEVRGNPPQTLVVQEAGRPDRRL